MLLLCSCRPFREPLRGGANLWPGYEPLYLAQREGLLPEDEFQVIRLASAEQVISAFRNQAVDVAAVTADEAIRVASRLRGARVILVTGKLTSELRAQAASAGVGEVISQPVELADLTAAIERLKGG